MSGDQDEKFQDQMARRLRGVEGFVEISNLLDELSKPDRRALRKDEIERYLFQLNGALETVGYLHGTEFEKPDAVWILSISNKAFKCTDFLLVVEDQLSIEDKKRFYECRDEFRHMEEHYSKDKEENQLEDQCSSIQS